MTEFRSILVNLCRLIVILDIIVTSWFAVAVDITAVACEGSKMELSCAPGEELHILSANYGRTTKSTCPDRYDNDKNCFASNSYEIVKKICEKKNKCRVDAINSIFSDPCSGTYKYLEARYTCNHVLPCNTTYSCDDGTCLNKNEICDGKKDCSDGEDEQGCDYMTEYACEFNKLQLSCKRGEILSIVNANYGRLSNKICVNKDMRDLNCRSWLSANEIKYRCNGQLSCEISSNNNIFGDPCVGTYKYIEAHYKCLEAPPCSANEFQCDNAKCIPSSKVCDGQADCDNSEDEKSCGYSTNFACENSNLLIKCKPNQTMVIVGANYGRQQKELCTYQENDKCLSSSTLVVVKNKCNGKSECVLSARNSVFGDPCPGVLKYLSVNYKCHGGAKVFEIPNLFIRNGDLNIPIN